VTAVPSPQQPSALRRLVRRGVVAGAVAAVGTSAMAAVARAAGVDLEVDGTPVPVAAFALWTVVGAALGMLLAHVLRTPRRFVTVAVAATGVSLVPPLALPDDAATKAVLVAAHLLAALIVVPTLGQGLTTRAHGDGAARR